MTRRPTRQHVRAAPVTSGPGITLVFVLGAFVFLAVALIVGYIMTGRGTMDVGGPEPLPIQQGPSATDTTPQDTFKPVQAATPPTVSIVPGPDDAQREAADDASAQGVIEMVAKDYYEKAAALANKEMYLTEEIRELLDRLTKLYGTTKYGQKAKELQAHLKPLVFPKTWWVVKGYSNPEDWSGTDRVFEPELAAFNPNQVFREGEREFRWQEATTEPSSHVNLLPGEWQVAYAYALMSSPAEQEVVFFIGSDDTAKLWLNGRMVYSNYTPRGSKRGEDRVREVVKAGTNTLLLKVVQGGGDWGFHFEVGAGQPVTFQ